MSPSDSQPNVPLQLVLQIGRGANSDEEYGPGTVGQSCCRTKQWYVPILEPGVQAWALDFVRDKLILEKFQRPFTRMILGISGQHTKKS